MSTDMKQKLVLVGHGMVGQRLLEKLAEAQTEFDITVVCEEPRPAYDRVALTSFFSGKTAADLSLVPEGFFESSGFTLHLGERAVAIDRVRKQVEEAQKVADERMKAAEQAAE